MKVAISTIITAAALLATLSVATVQAKPRAGDFINLTKNGFKVYSMRCGEGQYATLCGNWNVKG